MLYYKINKPQNMDQEKEEKKENMDRPRSVWTDTQPGVYNKLSAMLSKAEEEENLKDEPAESREEEHIQGYRGRNS